MLNVRLDNDEAITMFLAANKDATGMLKFEHFTPMFRILLQKSYAVEGAATSTPFSTISHAFPGSLVSHTRRVLSST